MAVLGAGLIGRTHIKTILSAPHVAELVAVADPAADRSRTDCGGAAWFTDAREMLDRAKPEAVVIATPNGLHAEHGRLCCERAIHFIMEKPVTATLDEAEELVRTVKQSGVKTLTGHHRRYLAAVQQAKEWIDSGKLGKMIVASVVWATHKPDDYFKAQWRRQAGGGPLLINGIHEVDLLRYLCGEIATVIAFKSNATRGFEVEDTIAAAIQFENGCLGSLTCTDTGFSPWTIEQGSGENPMFANTDESSYRLVGTHGSLELPVVRTWNGRTPRDIGWDRPIIRSCAPYRYVDPYIEQLSHFQRMIRQDERPVVSVIDGAKTLAATLAIAQSGETRACCVPRSF